MPDADAHDLAHDPAEMVRARMAAAIRAAFPQITGEIDPLVAVSKQPEHGDYQCNAAMSLAKRLGKPPRAVAGAIVAKADLGDIAEPLTEESVAGPGFINITLRPSALARMLRAMDDARLGVASIATPQTIVVDLMGVNLAKQMHVGHLRSPVIGDAIARIFARLGHRVIRQNHVGDWGLNIAMTTARVMRLAAEGKLQIDKLTLDDLDRAYAAAQRECQRDLAGLHAARAWNMGPKAIAELEAQVEGATEAFAAAREMLLRLQRREPSATAVWKHIYDVTMRECLRVCALLEIAVTHEHTAGESSYAEELAPMVEDLLTRRVAHVDQGAVIVRLDNPPAGPRGEREEPIKEPCLIRKSDGGFLYATTDVCAVRRRVQRLGADRIVYAIDARQNLHLRQVFLASKIAGYATTKAGAWVRCEHAAFGMILGADGKPFKTRSGDNVKLADLIEETFERSRAALGTRAAGLSEDQAKATARAVGIAALKYADLSTDRVKDSLFSFDKMLAFEGNTGPYLLYALVRIKNIFRKAANENLGQAWKDAAFSTAHPTEKQLALVLLRYGRALAAAAEAVEPHRLCNYLFELAGAFASFYDQCPVLSERGATRDGRLRLCHLTARVLEDGLACLGIPPAERM